MQVVTVPAIDIAPALTGDPRGMREVAREINRACEEVGFFVITGHGISADVADAFFAAGRRFFDLPVAEKMTVRKGLAADGSGYYPVANTSRSIENGSAPPDIRESFGVIREGSASGRVNRWPADAPDLKEAGLRYYGAMGALAHTLATIFACALDLPPGYFDAKIDRHDSVLVIHNYPEQIEPPVPGQLRTHAHSDIGLFTLLRTEKMHKPGGLEVKTRDGSWIDVPPVDDSFIINIGDTMMRWTNDRWISTMHRVVNPPRDLAAGNTRMSIPFFFKANYDTMIECLPSCCDAGNPARYEPIMAGKYNDEKFGKTYQNLQYDTE